MVMVLGYFFPEKKFTLKQMSKKMKRKKGKWVAPSHAAVVLRNLGLSVKAYANKDIPIERKKLINLYKRAFGKNYEKLIKNINLDVEEYFDRKVKKEKIFEVRKHSLRDFEGYLRKGYIVVPCVDTNILWKRKKKSFAGHFVTILKIDKNNVWIHDPTKGPNIKHPRRLFNKAFKVKAIDDDVLVIFGKLKKTR